MGRRSRKRVRTGLQSPNECRQHARQSDFEGSRRPDQSGEIERQFLGALRKFHYGEGAYAAQELANLARWWSEGIGGAADVKPPLVPALLWSHLCGEIEEAWERGWQPADVSRVASRKLSANHGKLAVDVIAGQADSYRPVKGLCPRGWISSTESAPLCDGILGQTISPSLPLRMGSTSRAS